MQLSEYLKTVESQTSLARRIGVSQGLVYQWVSGRTRITAERALQIESATEGKVSRHETRPDIFGEAKAA
jgi:DNA-binding transcriptional regulator YdaS (Cro superfamily)